MENAIVIVVVGSFLWIEWLLLRRVGGTRVDRQDPCAPDEDAARSGGPVDQSIEHGV